MKKFPGVIYYHDELNDEFAFDNISPRKIGADYIYIRNSIWKKFTRFFWYRIVALPAAALYLKIFWRHKIVNKKAIGQSGKNAFFIYGNHTHNICDALIPTFVAFPRSTYVIVHPNNISMPVLGRITPSLGAVPLPDDSASARNFMACIETLVGQKRAVAVYPEAHIWPFYTKIRPFASDSFRYPVQYKVPSFCFTNVYTKRIFSKKPRITTYIDGPFFPEQGLSAREQRESLRNKIFSAMTERAKLNNVEVIKYIKENLPAKGEQQ
ncbi:lysophospholipid acyltransferase family protein [Treponema sp.]|uniref:lysophospholipid acyltransferase family protein n=1 Tax=Treponema sp. TaxID=166 RepID=UPI003F0B9163